MFISEVHVNRCFGQPKPPTMKFIVSSHILLCAILAGSSSAALIAYENFNLTAGSNALAGSSGSGGSGFSTNWTTIGDATGGNVISPGYTYSGITSAGNRAEIFNASANSDASATYFYRTLSTPFTVAANSTGTLWASFMIQGTTAATTGLGAAIGFFGINAPTASTAGITVGSVGSSASYRVANRGLDTSGGGTVLTSATFAGTQSFMVAKITIDTNAGANETISLWINPTNFNGTEGSLGAAAISGSLSNLGISSISSIAFGSNYVSTVNPVLGLDEIRLGTTLTSVIPEPSSAMLGSLGMLALLRRRRNR